YCGVDSLHGTRPSTLHSTSFPLHLRRYSLYTPRVGSSSSLLRQVGQFQQVLVTKQAPPGRHGHKRIGIHRRGPARRNRAQSPADIVEVDSILAPVVAIGDQLELLTSERMMRVDDFKVGISMVAMRCS